MVVGIKAPNGMPMYLVGRLINDFKIIFCQARPNLICFLGARDHLAIHLKIFNRDRVFVSESDPNWSFVYAFNSDEVKREISWFRTKKNCTKSEILNIIPSENKLHIYNSFVDAELKSFVENPPIPRIQKMDDGVPIKIEALSEMVDQISPIKGEVIQLTLSNSEFKMSSSTHDSPIYNVRMHRNIKMDQGIGNVSTLCLKEMLLISCQLASEVEPHSAELRFYPGGATQVSSQGSNISVRGLLTAVKVQKLPIIG